MSASEWDRVLQKDASQGAGSPLGTAEDEDRRPLYDRLQEQRAKRHAEYLEGLKTANQAAVLLDEDVAYLESLEQHRQQQELARQREEEASLEEFKRQKKCRTGAKGDDPKSQPQRPSLTESLADGSAKEASPGPAVDRKRSLLGIKPKRKQS